MKKITLSLSDEVAEQMEAMAKSLGLNRSAYVSMCVKRQMEEDTLMKQLPQLTLVMEQAVNELRSKRNEDEKKQSE